VVRASDCQCQSSIPASSDTVSVSGIEGAADEAVRRKYIKIQENPPVIYDPNAGPTQTVEELYAIHVFVWYIIHLLC
jgi:hypothetical protein